MAGKTIKSSAKAAKSSTRKPAKSAKPILLAGGNPQIAKANGDTPVQAYIAALPGWKRDVGRCVDALIAHTVPDVRKAVKWNSSLHPVPPGESRHKEVRYLDIREHDRPDDAQLISWIEQAARLPGWVP